MEEKTHTYMNNIKGNLMDLLKEDIEDAYTLYVDMDGVLTDFKKRFMKYSTLSPNDYRDQYDNDRFWNLIKKGGVGYWAGMDWMSDGKSLWSFVKHLNPTKSEM